MSRSDFSIEVTLRSLDGLDDFSERKFVLGPSTTIPVGRSSRNSTKKLTSGVDNAFIDSPVISREHALLSTSTATGIPTVYITDNGSMHGTFVNNHPLHPMQEHRLHNGDTLQFGLNVVRDQDSFIAKKYRFLSQVPPTNLVSNGFGVSVPDMSSEEEDIEDDEVPRTARYGSQSNPVNLDDFEDVPHHVIELEEEDPAVVDEPTLLGMPETAQDSAKPSAYEPRTFFSEESASSRRFLFVADNDSEDEVLQDNYDGTQQAQVDTGGLDLENPLSAGEENSECQLGNDFNSEDEKDDISILSHSDAESDSESEGSDQEAEDIDADHRLKPEAIIEHPKQDTVDAVAGNERPSSPAQTLRPLVLPNPYTVQTTSKPMFHSSSAVHLSETVSPREAEAIAETGPNNNLIGEGYGDAAWDALLPRSAAPRPSFWASTSSVYFQGNLGGDIGQNQWYDVPPSNTVYSHNPGPDFRSTKMDYLGQVLNSEPTPTVGIQTPPIPASEEVNPNISQANNRTKVSISEIVEDAPQQPPTPTSVGSPRNLKRKIEVLDADQIETVEAPPASIVVETSGIEVAQAVTEDPPAKRRRGKFAGAATHVATFVAGGVFAIGALILAPEVTFTT